MDNRKKLLTKMDKLIQEIDEAIKVVDDDKKSIYITIK